MYKTIFYASIGLFICLSCKDHNPKKEEKSTISSLSIAEEKKCLEELAERKKLIKHILINKSIYSYLHLELDSRNPVIIFRDEFSQELDSIKLTPTSKIVFTDSILPLDERIKLEIHPKSCSPEKVIKFMFFSGYENAEVNGTAILNDSSWEINILSDIEF